MSIEQGGQHGLSEFGRYFLTLPVRLARLESGVRENQTMISGLKALREVLDREALTGGVLTGDPRLDAAICLSIMGPRERWINASVAVYKAIVETERRLRSWNGGVLLYDATSEVSPYRGELIFGRVSNPRLSIEFREGVREVEKAVAIQVETYEHLGYFNIGVGVIGFREKKGVLDITALFDPYWGGDSDLRYQSERSSAKEGLAGIFLGENEIKRHIYELKSNHRFTPEDSAMAIKFITKLEEFTESLYFGEYTPFS